MPSEYSADFLDTILVRDAAAKAVVSLEANSSVADARAWIESGQPGSTHQGFPVVDGNGDLVGVLTRRDLLGSSHAPAATLRDLLKRPPTIVYADNTLRDAADHMVNHNIGRLPVVDRATATLVGMITRSDLLAAHRVRLRDAQPAQPNINFARWSKKRVKA